MEPFIRFEYKDQKICEMHLMQPDEGGSYSLGHFDISIQELRGIFEHAASFLSLFDAGVLKSWNDGSNSG